MDHEEAVRDQRYESVFAVFAAGLAYLARGNPDLRYPEVLYLLLLFFGLNLAAGAALRLWPTRRAPAAAFTMANTAIVAAVVAASGAERSLFWVLYLLPVYTAALLLGGRELALVAGGAVLFNAVPALLAPELSGAQALVHAGLKGGLISAAALAVWSMARRERGARRELERQAEQVAALEANLLAKQARLESAERLRGETVDAAGILHDARTPLTVIQGSASLALTEALPAAAVEHVERIRRAARLCEHILVQLLESARRQPPRFVPVEVNGLLETAAALRQAEIQLKRISVRRELCRELPLVMADPMSLERVFLNLVSNALEAMPAGGTLTLRTGLLRAPDGTPLSVRAVVEDTGPGLPEAGCRPGVSSKAGGFGLGLDVSRRSVQRHGGALWAENRPEGGARFIVDLPRTAPAVVPA